MVGGKKASASVCACRKAVEFRLKLFDRVDADADPASFVDLFQDRGLFVRGVLTGHLALDCQKIAERLTRVSLRQDAEDVRDPVEGPLTPRRGEEYELRRELVPELRCDTLSSELPTSLCLKGHILFYRPVQTDRHFSKEIQYSDVDWTKLSSIVPAFEARITEWYIIPAKELAKDWHNAFSVAALDCLLIDSMAQFAKGSPESTRDIFIDFVKDNIPAFRPALPAIIKQNGKPDITTPAEALYFGFRCPILHEAHIPPYCQILPETSIVSARPTGKTTYADGTDCCAVILDPLRLLTALEALFNTYTADLLAPGVANDTLRANFKKKFKNSFGIDITTAT